MNQEVSFYNIYWSKYEKLFDTQTVYDIYWKKLNDSQSTLTVYEIYWQKYKNEYYEPKKSAVKTEGEITPNEKWTYSSGNKNSNDDINIGKTTKKIHELRSTPGYTNYVVETKKDLSGAVSSAQLKRYYSNIDAEIYMNGEWVEDIGTIQWTINQQTMPIYGYNSYIYDAVAQGSRLIQGSFTISFSSPRKIEEYIKTLKTNIDSNLKAAVYEDVLKYLQKNTVSLNRNGSTLTSNEIHKPIWMNDRFDIDIVCGEYESIGGNAVHIILQDCYLTDVTSMRGKDGGVAEEQYSFIARDYKTIS